MINESQQLSDRERQILHLVATGRSNQQIANELGISVNTVKVHLRNVFGKIGAASRTEATMYAVRHGIVTVDRPLSDLAPSTAEGDSSAALAEPEGEAAPPADALDAPVDTAVEAPAAPSDTQPSAALAPLLSQPVVEPLTPASPSSPVIVVAPPEPRSQRGRLMLALIAGLVVLVLVLTGVVLVLQSRSTAVQTATAPLNEARWSTLPELPAPRAAFAVAAADNRLFVIGGESDAGILNSVLRYDPRDRTWIELSQKPTPVTDVRAATIGGKIYVPGGRRSEQPQDISAALERYDPASESWEQLQDLPAPRSGYALAALEGKLYLFGGWDGTTYRAEVFEYDPERDTWQERDAMPTPRAFAEAAVSQNAIYVLGGEDASGALRSNERFTPSDDGGRPWSKRPPLLQARSRFGAAIALSTIYVFGGTDVDQSALQYSTSTEAWQILTTPEALNAQPGVVLLDELVVVLGGKLSAGGYSADARSYQAVFTNFLPRQ